MLVAAHVPRVQARLKKAKCNVQTYSADENAGAEWTARNVDVSQDGLRFDLTQDGVTQDRYFLPMSGRHNLENAVAALAVGLSQGCSPKDLAAGLATFTGIARRQSVVAEEGGIRVLDDFAHHPTAVQRTLEGLRERWPDGRLIAVFEPRSATSSRAVFQDAYAEAFGAANEAIIAKVGRPEIPAHERLDPDKLASAIQARGGRARHVPEVDDIVRILANDTVAGDTVVIMSNGGFGGIHTKVRQALKARFAAD